MCASVLSPAADSPAGCRLISVSADRAARLGGSAAAVVSNSDPVCAVHVVSGGSDSLAASVLLRLGPSSPEQSGHMLWGLRATFLHRLLGLFVLKGGEPCGLRDACRRTDYTFSASSCLSKKPCIIVGAYTFLPCLIFLSTFLKSRRVPSRAGSRFLSLFLSLSCGDSGGPGLIGQRLSNAKSAASLSKQTSRRPLPARRSCGRVRQSAGSSPPRRTQPELVIPLWGETRLICATASSLLYALFSTLVHVLPSLVFSKLCFTLRVSGSRTSGSR